jgi:hypothetical protein
MVRRRNRFEHMDTLESSESQEEETFERYIKPEPKLKECVVCLEEVVTKRVIYKCPCGVCLCNDCFVEWAIQQINN